ncbi:hypothetical protein HHI36_008615 [Cryptolaemus montrouzieri]|uniref:Carboxypeptidase n=1 Tax=Cryptolaemus montrouzieri TaxID=559131 RepID=A0ABD2MSZ6_9CUCU
MYRVTLFCLTTCIILHFSHSISSFPNIYQKTKTVPLNENEDNGETLILTPYIENGNIEEARRLAEVKHEAFQNITHYAGFFTVNKTYNSNFFMWFFPSESNSTDPVVLWLQGGPGATSMYGLFTENGPFEINNQSEVILREKSWTKMNNLLYIDNPAGAGYSFTDHGGYAHDEDQIGEELFQAIQQFFLLFPELRKNEFFLTGESYAGHYIPAVGHKILGKNTALPDDLKINLKGLAIGNGWTDPINQMDFGEYLFQHGIVDSNTKNIMDGRRDLAIQLINQEKYGEARTIYDDIILILKEVTGFKNIYNYLFALDTDDESLMDDFVQRSDIRKAIHVGGATFQNGDQVNLALNDDVMKSVVHLLPDILANYRVLLFSGQVDIIVAYPLTINYLQKLNFSAAKEYKVAKRNIWYVDEDIAGFVKVAGNLTDLLVRDAGHMVASDQPAWAFDMINRFTRNIPFDVPL